MIFLKEDPRWVQMILKRCLDASSLSHTVPDAALGGRSLALKPTNWSNTFSDSIIANSIIFAKLG